ncbi:MAG: hypothetical protein AAF513_02960 [Pseudomonadota bacterium]
MQLTITIIHIAGGILALLMGAVALTLRKGGARHRQTGLWYTAAMVVMALPGGILSYVLGKPFDVLSSLVALYMALTGWLAFAPPVKPTIYAMQGGAMLCLCGYLAVEVYGQQTGVRSTDAPPGAGYVFAGILALALLGDTRLHRPCTRRQITRRHLWRMNFGLFMACASFFGARPHLFPEWMQTYGILLLLSVAPLGVMAYWQVRLRNRRSQTV